MLQWGRGCSSAESRARRSRHGYRDRLQWGRGCSSAESTMSRRADASVTGFNGAADVHPRNRMLDARPVARPASMGPRMFIRGIVLGRSCVDAVSLGASMGPRMFIRGIAPQPRDADPSIRLQWGRGCSSAESSSTVCLERCRCSRFNGAADVHPRNRRVRSRHRCWLSASMGPRMFIRGIGVDPAYVEPCFNGAADVHPRNHSYEALG